MPTYRKADKEVLDVVKELIEAQHPSLSEAGIRIACLFAFAETNEKTGEPKGPAIKLHGYPCAATVKIVSHKDRVAGLPDAIINIDGEGWSEWSEERRRAILDHELTHLEVRRDDQGSVLLDDCHRPKLKMRLHDWQIGGFAEIAKRYGEASGEAEQFSRIADEYGNLLLPFMQAESVS